MSATETSWMDALPDELLVLILGHLDHGETLLDVVPLVCKRWHRVSKDPRAWAGVVVRLSFCGRDSDGESDSDDDHCGTIEEFREKIHSRMVVSTARVILHAPSLLRLVYFHYSSLFKLCQFEARVVQSALRRTNTTLRELVVESPRFLEHWVPAGVVMDLLARFRDSLRTVKLGVLLTTEAMRIAVSQVTGLTTLCLSMGRSIPAGTLADGALPNHLKHLEVTNYMHRESGDYEQLVATLIRSSAGTLRQLHILGSHSRKARYGYGGDIRLSSADAAEVRRCEGLRELTCCLEDAAVLPALPQLQRLKLFTRYDYGFALSENITALALNAATDALLLGGPLASLRVLSVELTLPRPHKHSGRRERLRPVVESLLRALATAASRVTHLELDLDGLPFAGLFLESMLHLQSVTLRNFAFSPSIMVLLAKLPELTKLVMDPDYAKCPEGPCEPDVEPESFLAPGEKASDDMTVGDALASLRSVRSLTLRLFCFPSALAVIATLPKLKSLTADVVYYDDSEKSHCEAAISDFKSQRPDVNSNLRNKWKDQERPSSGQSP